MEENKLVNQFLVLTKKKLAYFKRVDHLGTMTIRLRSISPIQVFFQEKQHDYREQHRNTKCVRRLEFNQKILRRMKKKILLSLVHGLVPNTYMKLLSRDKHQVGMSNNKEDR